MILLAQLHIISHQFIDFFSWQRNVCLLLTKNYWEFDFIENFYRFCSSLLFADRIIIVRWRLKNPRRKKNYWILLLFILLLFVVIFRLLFGFERWWQKRRERERKKYLKSISFQIANNIDNDRFFWKHSFKTKI